VHKCNLCYLRFWAHERVSMFFLYITSGDNLYDVVRASCSPGFFLAFAGSWMIVLGAVFTDNVIGHDPNSR
jgi:hypothetical protein